MTPCARPQQERLTNMTQPPHEDKADKITTIAAPDRRCYISFHIQKRAAFRLLSHISPAVLLLFVKIIYLNFYRDDISDVMYAASL